MIPGMTEAESNIAAGQNQPRRASGGKTPPRSFWVLLVLCVLAALVARRMIDDPSLARIIMWVSFGLCSLYLGSWFFRKSSYTPKTVNAIALAWLENE